MKKLTEGNLYKNFILFAIPIVLSGLLSQGYTIINTIIAGKFLGNDGLSAVGSCSSLVTFISSIFWGYSAGYSIYVAKLFGAGDNKELKKVVCNNIAAIFSVTIFVSAVVILFRNQILDFLKVDESIRSQAAVYMTTIFCGLCLATVNTSCVFVMQAIGLSTFPFVMSAISAVTTIIGNVFTVTVLEWGVFGIAISSIAASVIVSICYGIKIKKCFAELGVEKHRVSFDIKVFKESFPYSVPTMLQQMVMYFATLLIAPMVNAIGSAATASYVVVQKVYDLNAGVYQNSAKSVSNYTAQSVGARRFKNLKKGVKVGFIQGVVLLSPMLLGCVFFAEPVCKLFFPKNGGAEALEYSLIFSRIYLPFIYINVINNLFHAFFRGTASMKLLFTSTAIGAVSRLIFTALFVEKFAMSGVFIGWVISWAVEAVFAVAMYLSGRWKKNIKGYSLQQ
ncbi:MAG: hypothetical protein J6C82_03010 [Clostridia bacterium]|nr:hypothetical protein [Clostridia bacterium]